MQIATLDAMNSNAVSRLIYWDPAEPVATRPLMVSLANSGTFFPTVDLTKNVCELIDVNLDIATTYDYTPFGSISIFGTYSTPFQFSSEFTDSELGLVYYNYRHHNLTDGRWLSRDPIAEQGGLNLYCFIGNKISNKIEIFGLYGDDIHYYFILGLLSDFEVTTSVDIAKAAIYVDYSKWSATSNLFMKDGNRNRRLLHNLNDLTAEGISEYRACIVKLFQEQSQTMSSAQGVLLHVLGDTFAHKKDDGSGYGYLLGHAFDGNTPDRIGVGRGIGHFIQFTLLLKQLFGQTMTDSLDLRLLFADIFILSGKLKNDSVQLSNEEITKRIKEYAKQTSQQQEKLLTENDLSNYKSDATIDRAVECLLPCLQKCLDSVKSR